MNSTGNPRLGSGGHARGVDRLHPVMRSRMWQPGQSGNPSGHSGEYDTAIKLTQRAAPKAVRRLIELMESSDERVAVVACNSILDRAFGKPKAAGEEKDDLLARLEAMTPEQRVEEARKLLEEGRGYLPAYLEWSASEAGKAQVNPGRPRSRNDQGD